jgi:aspartate racemase
MTTAVEPKTLGLVAGLGVGAGVLYYRSLVKTHLERGLSPRIVMVHAEVRRVVSLAAARENQKLAEYLAGLLRQLAGGGAEIATIPAFTPQVCARELEELTPLPLISLLDAIVAEVKQRGLHRVAIFGGRVTMETGLFGKLQNVAEVVNLPAAELERVSAIYGRIVENEGATAEEFEALRSLAHRIVQQEGAEAILLAGTDLSFVFRPENTDFPYLDGARVHIGEIMRVVAGAVDDR